jgi:hypothetical protein
MAVGVRVTVWVAVGVGVMLGEQAASKKAIKPSRN